MNSNILRLALLLCAIICISARGGHHTGHHNQNSESREQDSVASQDSWASQASQEAQDSAAQDSLASQASNEAQDSAQPQDSAAPEDDEDTSPPSQPSGPNPNGRLCPAGQIWSPAPGTTWQLQLTGTVDTSIDVQFIDIDMFDNDASTIAALHESGIAVSCYFSSQYEDWRPDSASFTNDILGNALDDWPGENWVDIRSSKLRDILTARMDIAVSKGCDAIDIDNVDEYQADNGLDITADDQMEFNIYMAQQAHARGLSVGLKNDLDQITTLASYFDWSLNEQCNEYGECAMLAPFVALGKAVFGVEYNEDISQFCPAMKTMQFSFLKKTLDLDASGTECCTSTGGCSGASYTCKSATDNSKRNLSVNNVAPQVAQPQAVVEQEYTHSAAPSLFVPLALLISAVVLAC